MNPILKYILSILTIIFMLFFLIQINNLFCTKSNKCRPFLISYYYNKYKYGNIDVDITTQYQINNRNKNIEVSIDYDKKISRIGNIVNSKIIYKNLTNNSTVVKNNFEFEYKLINDFVKMLKCPCSSKIILKPNEIKIIDIEFFYHMMVSKSSYDSLIELIKNNPTMAINDDENTDGSQIFVKMNLNFD